MLCQPLSKFVAIACRGVVYIPRRERLAQCLEAFCVALDDEDARFFYPLRTRQDRLWCRRIQSKGGGKKEGAADAGFALDPHASAHALY